jgi:hypothetical protein
VGGIGIVSILQRTDEPKQVIGLLKKHRPRWFPVGTEPGNGLQRFGARSEAHPLQSIKTNPHQQ